MTQIAFRPPHLKTEGRPIDMLTHAAWEFAHAALWQEENIKPKEIAWAKQEIASYLLSHEDREHAFTSFCERITIANRYAVAQKSKLITCPSIWFSKNFTGGFLSTLQFHEHLQTNQHEIPQLWAGICTLAHYYWQYTQKPCRKTFTSCRKKLRELKEYGLLQLFYNAIIYSQFLNPNKKYGTVNR